MIYAKIENDNILEYPVYEGTIRERFRDVSFPVPFEPPVGYVVVEDSPHPALDHTKNLSEGTPIFSDGIWKRNWVVVNALPEEIEVRTEQQLTTIRNQRNSKLRATDWTQTPDAPVDSEAWATYRQLLRDLPDTLTDPFNVEWPVPPT